MSTAHQISIDLELAKRTLHFMMDVLSTDEAALIFTSEELTSHGADTETIFRLIIGTNPQ